MEFCELRLRIVPVVPAGHGCASLLPTNADRNEGLPDRAKVLFEVCRVAPCQDVPIVVLLLIDLCLLARFVERLFFELGVAIKEVYGLCVKYC